MPTKGERGEHGARGRRGLRGQRGKRGPAGPVPTRSQILEAAHSEFDELRKQLHIQLQRTAQMQQQLDAIQNLLKRALEKA